MQTKALTADSVFVFDLDDTLYHEADYQRSGFREVARRLEGVCGFRLDSSLDEFMAENGSDILGGFCQAAGLPDAARESLLWIYRLHEPDIHLSDSVKRTITVLESRSAGLAILSDGRSITQRLKLRALGLLNIPAYISEDYADEKPSQLRFQKIMRDMPARHYIYVADNPQKDFIAPNRLGWTTIGLIDQPENVHSQVLSELSDDFFPLLWIKNFSDLLAVFRC